MTLENHAKKPDFSLPSTIAHPFMRDISIRAIHHPAKHPEPQKKPARAGFFGVFHAQSTQPSSVYLESVRFLVADFLVSET